MSLFESFLAAVGMLLSLPLVLGVTFWPLVLHALIGWPPAWAMAPVMAVWLLVVLLTALIFGLTNG